MFLNNNAIESEKVLTFIFAFRPTSKQQSENYH